jgi:hypothetical protein
VANGVILGFFLITKQVPRAKMFIIADTIRRKIEK